MRIISTQCDAYVNGSARNGIDDARAEFAAAYRTVIGGLKALQGIKDRQNITLAAIRRTDT